MHRLVVYLLPRVEIDSDFLHNIHQRGQQRGVRRQLARLAQHH